MGYPLKNFESARNTAQQIIRGETSSTELVERSLERIKRLNPAINAIITLDEERALVAAKQADAQRGRDNLPPLHGLPVTIKDAFETAGLRTTSSYMSPPLLQ